MRPDTSEMAHGRPTQRGRCSRDHRIRFRPISDQFRRDGTQASSPYPQTGTGSKQTGKNLGGCRAPGQRGALDATLEDHGRLCGGSDPLHQKGPRGESPLSQPWPDDVHSPFWPPTAKWGDGSKRRLYLSVLEAMDEQLGKLFDFVRNDPQLAHNTVILACSDNGAEKGAGVSGPFRGFKTHLFEGGIRSSLVVWGPGFIPSEKKRNTGKVNLKSVFSAVDLVPTLLDLAGVPHPKAFSTTANPCPTFCSAKAKTPQTTALLSPSARPRLFLRSQGFTRFGRSLRKMEIALRV